MNKLFIAAVLLVAFTTTKSQEVKRTIGVGLQSSFPMYGLSVKYAVTEQSVIQATIAPFGASTDGGSVSMNFYGARYIHRFPGDDGANTVIDPYLFVGGGLVNYTTNYTALGLGKTSSSFFGYSAGGGVELLVASKFGLSGELGYGKWGITSGVAVNSILFGVGAHFYIK